MNLNTEFLNEFKKLDKLLSEAYEDIHGITAYIDEMKASDGNDISGWNDDFKRLKTLRNIRNKLIHEVGYDEVDRVTKSDIEYIKGFYQRFLKSTDPLAQLYKKEKPKKNKKKDETNWVLIFSITFIIFILSIIAGIIINSSL